MVDNSTPIAGQPIQPLGANPLAKHIRQPKIYIKLPSDGHYWPEGTLEKTENKEYAVYAMTAKDEIIFKTPDALLNGQATVDVIQSCMPNVKDAWQTPSIDLDSIMVAIRMASYGEKLDMNGKVPNTDLDKAYVLDLRQILDRYVATEYVDTFKIEGFTIQIKPVNYKSFTTVANKMFEEQRIFSVVNDDAIDQQTKLEKFQQSLSALTTINVDTVVDSVVAIQPDGEDQPVVNKHHIKEFIEGAEAGIFNQIKTHIDDMAKKFTQQPLKVQATEEEIEAGAPKEYEMPIVFDQSNFFASGS